MYLCIVNAVKQSKVQLSKVRLSSIRSFDRIKKKKPATIAGFNFNFADRTGLEPATSAVTGQHSNQLNYRSNILSAEIKIKY